MGKHVSKKENIVVKKLHDSVISISEFEEKRKITITDYIKIATAAVLLIIINLFKVHGIVELLAFMIPFFLLSYDTFLSAVKKGYNGTFPEDEILVIVCSILCFAIGSYTEAVLIVILYKAFLILDDVLKKKKNALDDFISIGFSGECTVLSEYGSEQKTVRSVHYEDRIRVENDAIVPLDGVLDTGEGTFDYSVFTGGDTLLNLKPGDKVSEGCVNVSGAPVVIRVTSEYFASTGYLLNGLIRSAESQSSDTELLVYRIIRLFRLICIPLAVIIAIIPGIITDRWFDCISRAVIILYVSQSKLLQNLIQYFFYSCIVHSALNGVFINGNKVIERISDTSAFVFEKSGVLTEGIYEIKNIVPVGLSESEMLAYAAKAESMSDHPLALALRRNLDSKTLSRYNLDHFTEYPGKGVSAYINGNKVYIGNYTFVSGFSDAHSYSDSSGTAVHLCINGKYAGYISFNDKLKDGAFDALEKIRSGRNAKLVMLTGDSAVTSRKLASALNFDMIKSEVSSEDKKNSLDYLIKNKNKGTWVTYIGNSRTEDMILKTAEVAVTFCSLYERPLVKESSDVMIFGSGIDKFSQTVTFSVSLIRKIKISSAFFGVAKILIILLGLIGILPVMHAVLIDTAVKIILAVYTLYSK